ncbi:MAG: response regulator transcription factor [Lachnospiraceae bacterium]|nr:response regulator transcription factor [Lachnospiraceae bacterium]
MIINNEKNSKSLIKTIIVEDNIYMQKHLVGMIEDAGNFKIVARLRDAFEAEKICSREKVDLVLMDVQTLHNHSGLAAGKNIRNMGQGTKVVIITSLIDPEVLDKSKEGAANSLWYKDYGNEDLLEIINRTLKGENIFPDESPNVELNEMHSAEINPKQLEILRLFVKGLTYDEIAESMDLSKNGVRWNLDKIIEKGGFSNKHEMLAAVIENKLIVTTLKDD